MDNLIELFCVELQNSANARVGVDRACVHLKIYSDPLLNFPLAADHIIYQIYLTESFIFSPL